MTFAEADNRIFLSHKIMALWLRKGVPSATMGDSMGLIRDEVETLNGLAMAHPDLSPKVRELVVQYMNLLALLRQKMD